MPVKNPNLSIDNNNLFGLKANFLFNSLKFTLSIGQINFLIRLLYDKYFTAIPFAFIIFFF